VNVAAGDVGTREARRTALVLSAAQLKETTMDPAKRTLLQVRIPDRYGRDEAERAAARRTAELVESLMGRKPELRFSFIQENARFVDNIDV